MNSRLLRRLQWAGIAAIAVCALLLCWKGVSWALRPGWFLWNDELGNLVWLLDTPYRAILHVLPMQVYNDRPTGEALERVLYEMFGFDYRRQLACFLCFHFANCALVFLLLRRLGVGLAIGLAGMGLFGSLSTTAITATYIGASFDILCTFFLLGSILTGLGKTRLAWYSSALLFLLALRSKEFAIVIPVILTLLLLNREGQTPWRHAAAALGKRLWLHYAILAIFGIRYLSFVPRMRDSMPRQHPYYLDPSLGTVLRSFAHYTALIFTLEDRGIVTTLFLLGLIIIFACAATMPQRRWIFCGLAGYFLTLLPAAMLSNIRQPLYVYGPQIFLILAICIFLESLPAALPIPESGRWVAAVCIAVALLAGAYAIRTSAYFRLRIGFFRDVRETCARTARSAAAQLSGIGTGARLYIASGNSTPWLMTAGPCDYLKLWRHDRTISCVILKPEKELLELYGRDPGAGGKYFVDYREDGSLRIRF
jgi:hypothetical protein